MPPTNNQRTFPTGIEKRILSSRLYERIRVFYENPDNLRRFEAWQMERRESGCNNQA